MSGMLDYLCYACVGIVDQNGIHKLNLAEQLGAEIDGFQAFAIM